MILEAQQAFELRYPAGTEAATAFVRDPARSLSQLAFLRGLHTTEEQISGELVVTFAIIGEVTLPFCSNIQATPTGAQLIPLPLEGERAWAEVQGNAAAYAEGQIKFDFAFRAHIALPDTQGWGGAAFEKMVRAAAERTFERLSTELPAGLAKAMQQSGSIK